MLLRTLYIMLPTVKETMHLQGNTFFGLRVTKNVAQYPLDKMAYSPARVEVSTSNR